MEWDDATVIKLIDLYHLKEILWNPKNRDYKSRPKRYDAFNEIASEFATDVPEIERKIKNLTSHYYREKKKEDNSNKSGAGTDDIYHSKWFAYKSLNFLRNKNVPTGTTDTVKSQSNQNDLPQMSPGDSQSNHNDLPQMSPENTTWQRNKRPKINPNKELISEALNIMKNVSQRPNVTKDEDGLFGDYIAGQLRQMDRQMKAIVRHRINNIIFEAETGYRSDTFTDFARPSSVSSSHSHPGYYTASSLQQAVVSPSTNNLTSSEYSAQTNSDPQTIQPSSLETFAEEYLPSSKSF
ncbi:uncharacterized protein LOC132903348 [Amyelois transitella]|uniref:uncharacterized protein LOC132903348 n=1 Tax=Amyelois transitella TaxID=680683 RepID=UPI002990658C|nr:uncharacterized protein LOC132903348 [Amyelois transitella]